VSLADNVEFFRRLPKPSLAAGRPQLARALRPNQSPLVEVREFGSNPGNLRMYALAPANPQQPRALVVVLHGCGQTAAGYDLGAGWSPLARHYGFALLMPEQQLSNNPHGCFNWFNAQDVTRDKGEVCSIRQMIARMVSDHRIDPKRIFITGLSAGGAMTSAMLATYPEVFAAGAVIAGLPFGVARDMRDALTAMRASLPRAASDLGDLVRKASPHRGRWPRLSVWHGSADRTVHPGNAGEIVKQWLDLHRLPLAPMSEGKVDGHPHQVWWNPDGETIVESYTITDMAHGTPLGVADNDKRYGKKGAFLIEAGISSSYHIAKFFGLTSWIRESRKAPADSPSAKLIPAVSPIAPMLPMPDFSKLMPDLSKMGWPAPTPAIPAEPVAAATPQATAKPRRRRIGAAIARALVWWFRSSLPSRGEFFKRTSEPEPH
jgi:poly(hydroxyalkanoate) depolymerase family esterase